ncbi:hypothetical protein EBZ80_25795 [bacterium]|nr:hypothetical protein [bacterium]
MNRVKKGDTVVIIAGRYRGQKAKVLEVNLFYGDTVKQIKVRTHLVPLHQFFNVILRKCSTHSFQFSLQRILSLLSNFSLFIF